MLRDPAAGAVEYRPLLGKWVLMLTGAFAKVSSQAAGFESWGYVDEAQTSLWVPVGAGRTRDGVFVIERICMAVPYILVNNAMSYAGGREVYGYPKSLGEFDPPSGVGDRLQVKAFGGNFAPANEASWHTLLELSRGGTGAEQAGAHEHGGLWHELEGALGGLRDFFLRGQLELPDIRAIEDIVRAIAGRQIRQVFLKQFRDVHTADAACYQAVIEAPIDFISTRMRPSLEEWSVVITPLDSHPIGRELGVATQTTRLTFDVQMDFVAAAGEPVAP
jgi:hypothetical protein